MTTKRVVSAIRKTAKRQKEESKMKNKILTTTLICLALVLTTLTNLPTLSTSATYTKTDLYSDMFNCSQPSSLIDHPQNNKNMNELAVTETVTDPWPEHDELTENVAWPPLDPWDGFSVPGYGLWWDLYSGGWGNQMLVDNRTNNVCVGKHSVMSRVRVFGIGDPYWIPHYVVFWPDAYLDLIKWRYIKYQICLGAWCDGFCQIGFFNGDIYGDYEYAVIDYTTPNDNQFYTKSFDCWDYSKWRVSAGFNWSTVNGLVFFARTSGCDGETSGLNDMWIDAPRLCNNATLIKGIIDEGDMKGSKIGLDVQFWHGETTPDYDYWALKIYVEDFWYTEHGGDEHPSYVNVYVRMSDFAEEVPPSHYPQAGEIGSARTSYGFSYHGIGFSVTPPEKYISYSRHYENDMLNIKWKVETSQILGTTSGFIFYDFAEFAIGFRTPRDAKPWAYVSTEVKIYEKSILEYFDYIYRSTETVGWVYVDPPDAEPLDPGEIEPIIAPETTHLVCMDKIQTFGGYRGETIKTDFKRDGYIWCLVNYTWGVVNATQQSIDVKMYDSEGTMVSCFMLKSWTHPGYYLRQKQDWFGTTVIIPKFAALGQAKIVVRILNDWPWIDDREYARMEMDINITE